MLRRKPKNFKSLKFEALSVRNQAQLIKTKGRCFNSLSPGHCCKHRNGSTLRNCNRKLNRLLLFQANSNPKRTSKASRVPTNYLTPKISHSGMEHSQQKHKKLYSRSTVADRGRRRFHPKAIATADNNGKAIELIAPPDSESWSKIITEDAVQHLGMKKDWADCRVFWLGVKEVDNNKWSLTLILKP